ncbi:MAG: hypothetical protein ACFB21_04380 [Opitutales bacterium]
MSRPLYFIRSKHAVTPIYFNGFRVALGEDTPALLTSERTILSSPPGNLVITKRFSGASFLRKAKTHGHCIIYVCSDVFCAKPKRLHRLFETHYEAFDRIIFPNQRTLEDFGRSTGRESVLIEVSQDAHRLRTCRVGFDQLKAGYFGNRQNRPAKVPGLPRDFLQRIDPYFSHAQFLEHGSDYNLHVSLRKTPEEVQYKPSPKILNAAYTDVPVLIQKGHMAELFGTEYPFYLENFDSWDALADRFSDQGEITHALETMRSIRSEHGLETFQRKIREIFASLA